MATLPSTSQAPVYCPGPEWRPWLRTPSWPTHASLTEICLKYPPWLWRWEWPLSWTPERLELNSRCLSLHYVSGLSSLVTYFAWTTGPITIPILIKWLYNEAVTQILLLLLYCNNVIPVYSNVMTVYNHLITVYRMIITHYLLNVSRSWFSSREHTKRLPCTRP